MALRGRRARRVLNDRKAEISAAPAASAPKLAHDIYKTKKLFPSILHSQVDILQSTFQSKMICLTVYVYLVQILPLPFISMTAVLLKV